MALSDYMPYGAPELLDAAPQRMARSTLVASLAVALLVASLGALLSRAVTSTAVAPEVVRDFDLMRLMPERSLDPPAPPEVVPAKPEKSFDPHSVPVVRPDEVVPPDDFSKVAPPDGRSGDGLVDPNGPATVAPGQGFAADPQPNEFVYTDEMPALVRAPAPRYPDLAREAGVEGIVTVQILVGLDGRVVRAIIAPRGSVPMLDEAALESARASVFTPALANGHPVKVWVSQQSRFRLH